MKVTSLCWQSFADKDPFSQPKCDLKIIWSVGKGSEIFQENSHLFSVPPESICVHASIVKLTLTVPSLVNPIDLLHIYMPMVMRGLRLFT